MGSRRRRLKRGTARRTDLFRGVPVTRGVPAPFSPLNIGNLVLWLRADMGTTIATGVSAWADQSGSNDPNRSMIQATGSAQPTFNVSDAAYNNKPTLSFASASSQCMAGVGTWSPLLPATATVVVVGNDDGTVTNQTYTWEGSGSAYLIATNNGGAGIDIYSGAFLASGTSNTSAARVVIGVFNGVSSAIYISALTPVATGNAGTNAMIGTMQVGQQAGGAFLNGEIAEVLVYARALNASEIANVLAYCGAKYAITIGG